MILVLPTPAAAQSVADQYVPQLDKGGAAQAPTEDPPGAASPGADATPPKPDETARDLAASEIDDSGQASGVSLPGSGFPLTPLVIVLLGLVAAGIAFRFVRPLLARDG